MNNLAEKIKTLQGKWVRVIPSGMTGTLVRLFEHKIKDDYGWEVIEIENSEGCNYIIVGQKTDIIEAIR